MKGTNTVLLREVKYDSYTGFITLNDGSVVQRFGREVINGAYLKPIDSIEEWEIEAEYVDRDSGTRIYEVMKPEALRDERLPETYAEIEYEDFDSVEAIDGARFDDANYNHYMER
jgi:hypothetical protein